MRWNANSDGNRNSLELANLRNFRLQSSHCFGPRSSEHLKTSQVNHGNASH